MIRQRNAVKEVDATVHMQIHRMEEKMAFLIQLQKKDRTEYSISGLICSRLNLHDE